MTTCRCGAWDGHPEARTCTIPDCELRGRIHDFPEPGHRLIGPNAIATGSSLNGRVTGAAGAGASPLAASVGGTFFDHAGDRDREGGGFVGGGEAADVHEQENARVAA